MNKAEKKEERFGSFAKMIRQLFSYFFVGGAAALVEWATFWLFNDVININYLLATFLAFMASTFVNLLIGRVTTFKNAEVRNHKKEAAAVYMISAAGLGFNLLLMFIFVSGISISAMPAKIISTGIVFFWNFFARKFWIYKI